MKYVFAYGYFDPILVASPCKHWPDWLVAMVLCEMATRVSLKLLCVANRGNCFHHSESTSWGGFTLGSHGAAFMCPCPRTRQILWPTAPWTVCCPWTILPTSVVVPMHGAPWSCSSANDLEGRWYFLQWQEQETLREHPHFDQWARAHGGGQTWAVPALSQVSSGLWDNPRTLSNLMSKIPPAHRVPWRSVSWPLLPNQLWQSPQAWWQSIWVHDGSRNTKWEKQKDSNILSSNSATCKLSLPDHPISSKT